MVTKLLLLVALVCAGGILSWCLFLRQKPDPALSIHRTEKAAPPTGTLPASPGNDPRDGQRPSQPSKAEMMNKVAAQAEQLLKRMKPHDRVGDWLASLQCPDGLWNPGDGAAADKEDNRVAASALAVWGLGYWYFKSRSLFVTALQTLLKEDNSLCQDQTANALAALVLGDITSCRNIGDVRWTSANNRFVGLVRFAFASQTPGGGWPAGVGGEGEDFLSTVCWMRASEGFPKYGLEDIEANAAGVGNLAEWRPGRDTYDCFRRSLDHWGKEVVRTGAGDNALLPMVVMLTRGIEEGGAMYREMASKAVKEGILPAPAGSFALAMMVEMAYRKASTDERTVLNEFYALVHGQVASKIGADGSWPDDPQIGPERGLWGRTGQAALAKGTLDGCRGFLERMVSDYKFFYELPEKMKTKEKAEKSRTEQENSIGGGVPTRPDK